MSRPCDKDAPTVALETPRPSLFACASRSARCSAHEGRTRALRRVLQHFANRLPPFEAGTASTQGSRKKTLRYTTGGPYEETRSSKNRDRSSARGAQDSHWNPDDEISRMTNRWSGERPTIDDRRHFVG